MITEEIKKYFKHITQENIWIRQFYGQDSHFQETYHLNFVQTFPDNRDRGNMFQFIETETL